MLDLKRDIAAFLADKEDPVKLKTVVAALGMGPSDRQYVRRLLAEMARDGQVVRMGVRYWAPDGREQALKIKRRKTRRRDDLVGRLSVSSQGTGFVEVVNGRDWLIPEHALAGAKQGDVVRARKRETDRGGRIIGEIAEILEFGTAAILGVFDRRGAKLDFLPFGDFPLNKAELLDFPSDAPAGSVGRFVRRPDGRWAYDGLLGDMEDPAIDETIALTENGIVAEFSDEVQAEADRFGKGYSFPLGDRADFRDELVFTIDGADARDFDDALHFRVLDDDQVEVGVHIADVSEFARPGSALDAWAREQGNSVYLPHKAIPMLPPVLSTGLCSLNPDEPRYTLSVVAALARRDGRVLSWEIRKGLIESRFRLTYDQVQAMGVDRDKDVRQRFAEVLPAIELGLDLSRKMRKRRLQAGGLDLDMAEVRLELDANQEMIRAVEKHGNDANRMIEAFMVMANECVAEHLSEIGVGAPFRIHDQPDREKLDTVVNFLKTFGCQPPHDVLRHPGQALNQLIGQIVDRPNAQALQTQILKAMKQAEYNEEDRGHFGLASKHYAHFTSPIRRYADLYIHQRLTRLLREPDLGPEHFGDDALPEICAHISKKERDAARAEQTFVNLKLLRRMLSEVGAEHDGVVAEVKPYGLFVQLDDPPASGLVHVETLEDDFELIPELFALAGRRSGKLYKVGLTVKVRVMAVDLIGRKIDLAVVSGGEPYKPSARQKSSRRREMERDMANMTAKKKGRGPKHGHRRAAADARKRGKKKLHSSKKGRGKK